MTARRLLLITATAAATPWLLAALYEIAGWARAAWDGPA